MHWLAASQPARQQASQGAPTTATRHRLPMMQACSALWEHERFVGSGCNRKRPAGSQLAGCLPASQPAAVQAGQAASLPAASSQPASQPASGWRREVEGPRQPGEAQQSGRQPASGRPPVAAAGWPAAVWFACWLVGLHAATGRQAAGLLGGERERARGRVWLAD